MEREEAIKTVKNNWPEGRLMLQEALQTLIPELNESEDERIRKWIEKELESKYVVDDIVNNVMASKALAWLEKQGKQESADKIEPKFQVGENMPTLEKIEKVYDPTIPFLYTDFCTSKSYVEMDGYRICVNDLFNKLPKEE